MMIKKNMLIVETKTGLAQINLLEVSALVTHAFLERLGDNERVTYIDLHIKSGTIFTTEQLDENDIDAIESAWWDLNES